MEQNEIILKITNDGIFVGSSLFIAIHQTNILKKYLTFRTHINIFWNVEAVSYDDSDKCLRVKVVDYSVTDITSYDHQSLKMNVDKIHFEKVDWNQLEPLLSSYTKSKLLSFIYNLDADPFLENYAPYKVPTTSSTRTSEIIYPTRTTIRANLVVPIKNVIFKQGAVEFTRYIPELRKDVAFTITNEYIKPEFDNIKLWFSKKWKTKGVKVSIEISVENYEPRYCIATSEQINQINPELIDSIKHDRTIAITRREADLSPGKHLFTHEEVFNHTDSDLLKGNVFAQTESDIINILKDRGSVRNKKQLEYLASKKQKGNHRLYYTLRPNFGFVFLIESAANNHFVWELLNSNATYIWSFSKGSAPEQFNKMEEIINKIRISGREFYKKDYNLGDNSNEVGFKAIPHTKIGSSSLDGFSIWEKNLNTIIS